MALQNIFCTRKETFWETNRKGVTIQHPVSKMNVDPLQDMKGLLSVHSGLRHRPRSLIIPFNNRKRSERRGVSRMPDDETDRVIHRYEGTASYLGPAPLATTADTATMAPPFILSYS